jgi:DNA-binding protein HU-beta
LPLSSPHFSFVVIVILEEKLSTFIVLNQNELAKKVAEENNLTVKAETAVVDSVLNTIMDTVAAGEEVQLFGFGSFGVKHRDAREGRNPATGETMTIAASNTPVFKPAKAFKDKV